MTPASAAVDVLGSASVSGPASPWPAGPLQGGEQARWLRAEGQEPRADNVLFLSLTQHEAPGRELTQLELVLSPQLSEHV